jgi:TRAP-type C4-dicarboxylate transport system permease large subunit
VPLHKVIRAVLPFLVPLLAVLVLVVAVPAVTLWVPSAMMGR